MDLIQDVNPPLLELDQKSKVYTTRPLTESDPTLPLLKCPHCTEYFIPEDLSHHISDQHVERQVVPVSTTTNVETTNSKFKCKAQEFNCKEIQMETLAYV